MGRYKTERQRIGTKRYTAREMMAATKNSTNITKERRRMPIYVSACACGENFEYFSSIANRNKTPKHCGKKTKRVIQAAMVAPLFQEYRAVGIPGQPWIKTKSEHLATLKRHNKVEVGNDSSLSAPKMSDAEFAHNKALEIQEIERDRASLQKIAKEAGMIGDNLAF